MRDLLAVDDRDEVDALVVTPVEFLALGDPLLDAEDVVSQLEGGGHLALAADAANLVGERVGHLSAYRRMSLFSALSLTYGPAWS